MTAECSGANTGNIWQSQEAGIQDAGSRCRAMGTTMARKGSSREEPLAAVDR